MKKKVVIFTGAGVSKESGIETFRDGENAYWNKYKIDDVATIDGWEKDQQKAFDFYNDMRKEISKYDPNEMHKAIANLEKDYDVTVITQNIDDLHERAGSTNVIHLHGELSKMRTFDNTHRFFNYDKDINVGDIGYDGSQLRPHVVLFGEQPYNYQDASDALISSRIKIVIGTSFNIGYTIPLVWAYPRGLYIDPKPSVLRNLGVNDQSITYVKKNATDAIKEMNEYINKF
jgi:NAD-dependent deacetylase